MRRAVYRVVGSPASENADLIVLWLWGEQAGVCSHETALALHDLSDALPGEVHLTVSRILTRLVGAREFDQVCPYPPLTESRRFSRAVAVSVAERTCATRLARRCRLRHLRRWIADLMPEP